MPQLPTAYVDQLYARAPRRARDGMAVDRLDELVEQLADADVHAPAVTALMRGKIFVDHAPATLVVLGDCRLGALADWAGALATATYTSIVGCALDEIGTADRPNKQDMPLLTGHGIVLASRGVSGQPLVGLSLEELRHELEESRLKMSETAGYQVRILMPTPSTLGNAVDGLVLEEAWRAGYKLVLRPGGSVSEIGDAHHHSTHIHTLQYRTIRTDDSAHHLRDWILGKGLSRQVAQVRDLVNRPRRILARLEKEAKR